MRGLKNEDIPILKGYQIFHNYIRQHEGLNGKTPAEACGIRARERISGSLLLKMRLDCARERIERIEFD